MLSTGGVGRRWNSVGHSDSEILMRGQWRWRCGAGSCWHGDVIEAMGMTHPEGLVNSLPEGRGQNQGSCSWAALPPGEQQSLMARPLPPSLPLSLPAPSCVCTVPYSGAQQLKRMGLTIASSGPGWSNSPDCSGKQQCFSIFFQPKGQTRTPSCTLK